MTSATIVLAFLLLATPCWGETLTPPARLTVDYQIGPVDPSGVAVAASLTPTFSFLPGRSLVTTRNASMVAYRVVVDNMADGRVWDSGRVAADNAVAIPCERTLAAGQVYNWTAWWWGSTSEDPSPPSEAASFDVALLVEEDWNGGTPWLGGGGQREFRIVFPTSQNEMSLELARLWVASTGGFVASVNGRTASAVGVSAWTDTSSRVMYEVRAIGHLLRPDLTEQTIIVRIGSGFYSGTPAARIRVRLVGGDGALTAHSSLEGRAGPIVVDSVTLGTTTDWTVGADDGWGEANRLPAADAPTGRLRPLATPSAAAGDWGEPIEAMAAPVRVNATTWHYVMPEMVVGHVELRAGSFEAGGAGGCISVKHCEVLDPARSPPACIDLSGLAGAGVVDAHFVAAGAGTGCLRPSFTWHGFQHVFVTVEGNVSFSGMRDAVAAHWTVPPLERTADVHFSSDGGGALLNRLQRMVVAAQRSNMAAYMPTDCPTREKHGWLGDAQVTAEEAMYNLFTPTVYRQFLALIRDQQLRSGDFAGFVPGVVPGAVQKPGDISWTAAYPLIARWCLLYYGDTALVRSHWPALKAWTDGAARVAAANGSALPDFWTWGDWCAVEDRATCTPGTGPQCAAANYVLALRAMTHIAGALGEEEDAVRYGAQLGAAQTAFDERFWNADVGSYVGARAGHPLEHQTLTATALAALRGWGPGIARASAAAEYLRDDVAKHAHHVTVGSAGQKWLMRELEAAAHHEDALLLATQTSFPSWGYWDSLGATTCWESWSGVADPSHPPNPTHNHIFLCGGLGEWLHRSMGGIAPAADGWAEARIAPRVSATVGPSQGSSWVLTVRGLIKSSWTRGNGGGSNSTLLELNVTVPVSIFATVRVPLLGNGARVLWNGRMHAVSAEMNAADAMAFGGVGSGAHTFIVVLA